MLGTFRHLESVQASHVRALTSARPFVELGHRRNSAPQQNGTQPQLAATNSQADMIRGFRSARQVVPYLLCPGLESLTPTECLVTRHQCEILRCMSQKRHPRGGWKSLSSKRGNQNYYKGRGGESVGMLSSTGYFVSLPSRMPHYILPSLDGTAV